MADVFPGKRTLVVAGMVEKKETEKVLAHFAGISSDFIATQPEYEGRAMAAETFAQYIRETRDPEGRPLNILEICGSPAEAVEAAHREAEKGYYDVILFTGSLYLIGAVRSILNRRTDYDYYRTLKYGTEATDGSNR
jgi:dihydrofolate synthase/folylpolyglutamate synthase